MSRGQDNTLAIIVWIVGLLGCTGYIDPFGFFALLLPILFLLLGNRLSKNHTKEYFNVLATAVMIYFIGFVLNSIIGIFDPNKTIFDMLYIALIYFAVMSLFGLISAINGRKYKALLAIQLFK